MTAKESLRRRKCQACGSTVFMRVYVLEDRFFIVGDHFEVTDTIAKDPFHMTFHCACCDAKYDEEDIEKLPLEEASSMVACTDEHRTQDMSNNRKPKEVSFATPL